MSHREALVGLLDAVLADPLVDWTSEREGMAARQNLELAVSLSLFVSRCVYMCYLGSVMLHCSFAKRQNLSQISQASICFYQSNPAGWRKCGTS